MKKIKVEIHTEVNLRLLAWVVFVLAVTAFAWPAGMFLGVLSAVLVVRGEVKDEEEATALQDVVPQ